MNEKVELYEMYAPNGRYIRKATKVTLSNGRVVKFMDRMPKGQAINQAFKIELREAGERALSEVQNDPRG